MRKRAGKRKKHYFVLPEAKAGSKKHNVGQKRSNVTLGGTEA